MSALAFSVCAIRRLILCRRRILTRTMYPFVPWSSAILVEPMFLHPDITDRIENLLPGGAIRRRDVWSSREEANKLFRERSFKSWDPRAIELYVVRTLHISCHSVLTAEQRYGLRDLPTSTYPDKTRGVTLNCTKVQEVVRHVVHSFQRSFDPHSL